MYLGDRSGYHSGKHPCRATYLYFIVKPSKIQVNIFKQRAAFPAAFSFLPYPKINNAPGHILQNLRKIVNEL
nr:MAG TPA: hypothetical protein [Caudoviricetes sp.]